MITQNQRLQDYVHFRDEFIGKPIDFDKKFGRQCVDVYRRYCAMFGIPQSPSVAGAKDIWNTFTTQYFDRFVNYPWSVPQPGDVLIWDGKYGHIAICDSANVWSLRAFGQNWYEGGTTNDGKGVCYITQHNYLKPRLIGWLRRK